MASNKTDYQNFYGTTADTTTGPSPAVWGDCPIAEIHENPSKGFGIYDDFLNGHATVDATTVITIAGGPVSWTAFFSSGGTITFDDALGGAIVLTEATTNESCSITMEQHPFRITSLLGDLWFEARVKTSTITASEQSFFVGLMDTTTMTAAIPLTATGTVADINCVGFHKQEANTTAFDFGYKADGVTAVETAADIGTLAADTYVKLGFRYKLSDTKLYYYIDGVPGSATKTIPNATGTDFPADIGLAPVLAMAIGTGTSETLTCDWIRCYQLRVS